MTQARTRTYGLMIPSPLDHWIDAMLCAFVELVLHATSTLRMRLRRPPVIGTQAMPQPLPEGTTGNQQQETELAAPQSSPTALMLRDREAIVSKHEGVLTAFCSELSGSGPLVRVPREGGDPVFSSRQAREAHAIPSRHVWIPAFAGNTAERARLIAPA